MTRAVYKAHEPSENYLKFGGVLFGNQTACQDCVKQILRTYIDWTKWTNENQPGLWSGFNNWGFYDVYGGVSFSSLFQGPESEALRAIQIFEDLADQSNGAIFWVDKKIENHDTFMGWHGDSTDTVGGSALIASRLIPAENFSTPESREALTEAFLATQGGMLVTVGKGNMEADPSQTSVTPAWRRAYIHYGANPGTVITETMSVSDFADRMVTTTELM